MNSVDHFHEDYKLQPCHRALFTHYFLILRTLNLDESYVYV